MKKAIKVSLLAIGQLAVIVGMFAFVWIMAAADSGNHSAEYDWAAEQTAKADAKDGKF